MKLSNVLLTAMLASTYSTLAQESRIKVDFDSLNISNTQTNSEEITLDSVLLKKIDSLYENRSRNRNIPKLIKQKTHSEKVTRPYFNCPGCGRG